MSTVCVCVYLSKVDVKTETSRHFTVNNGRTASNRPDFNEVLSECSATVAANTKTYYVFKDVGNVQIATKKPWSEREKVLQIKKNE